MTYLTVAQVADRLQVSQRLILDELRRKNLRGSRLSGRRAGWRISEEDLDTYIQAKANVSKVRGRSA